MHTGSVALAFRVDEEKLVFTFKTLDFGGRGSEIEGEEMDEGKKFRRET